MSGRGRAGEWAGPSRGVGRAEVSLQVVYLRGHDGLVYAAPIQMRLSMKSYSFIRENAYKVLYPWHKDDTSGEGLWGESCRLDCCPAPSPRACRVVRRADGANCGQLFTVPLLPVCTHPPLSGQISQVGVATLFQGLSHSCSLPLPCRKPGSINWVNVVIYFVQVTDCQPVSEYFYSYIYSHSFSIFLSSYRRYFLVCLCTAMPSIQPPCSESLE